MNPLATRISAMLTGRTKVIAAIGRLDYVGRFQPFGTVDVEASVTQSPSGLWEVSIEDVVVPYTYDSPRIITHVGVFVFDRWQLDKLVGEGKLMKPSDMARVSIRQQVGEPCESA